MNNTKTVSFEVLLQMAVRITLIVIIGALITYWHLYHSLVTQVSNELQLYASERGRGESALFTMAETNHRVLKAQFIDNLQNMQDVSPTAFNSLFEQADEGYVRLSPNAYKGYRGADGFLHNNMTAFVSPEAPINNQAFRNRLMLAYRLVDKFADAWTPYFADLYISMPEDANVVNWPNNAWADSVTANTNLSADEWFYIANPEHNPSRQSVWTGLYFDEVISKWMVSCETPIDVDGVHVATIGHDVLLEDLFYRLINHRLEGTHNFIFREDGRLIAHPEKVAELKQAQGNLFIDDMTDALLKQNYHALLADIQSSSASTFVREDGANYLAATKIKGPDWWFVVVYPKSLLSTPALKMAGFIGLLGVISLIIELISLYIVLKRKVRSPLGQIQQAIGYIGTGRYQEVSSGNVALPDTLSNEIGTLAQSFRDMAKEVESSQNQLRHIARNLEQQVVQRTEELEIAKQQAEQLARMDTLTQVTNRLGFTEIALTMLSIAKRESTPITLLILDIDFFKSVNDRYGHPVGDQVLIVFAKHLSESVRKSDLLARVGGEEFAIILHNTSQADGMRFANKLLQSIAALTIEIGDDQTLTITASIGLYTKVPDEHDQIADLYDAADRALYQAKQSGRNRVWAND